MSSFTGTRSSLYAQSLTNAKLRRSMQVISAIRQGDSFKIIINGEDLTPEPLNSLQSDIFKEVNVSFSDQTEKSTQSSTDLRAFPSQSISRFQTDLHKQTLQAQDHFQQSYISSDYLDDFIIEPERGDSSDSLILKEDENQRNIPGINKHYKTMPTQISLTLVETPTIFLLDLPSKTVEKHTPEATIIESANEKYEYITVGKGRNRKLIDVAVQTREMLKKSKFSEIERAKRKHNFSFASNWEMYDTYEEIKIQETQSITTEKVGNKKVVVKQPEDVSFEEFELMKLIENDSFLDAVCVIERLLANNNFNDEQKKFRGLIKQEAFREDIEYKYRLEFLWTFATKETTDRCVSAFSWSETNSDILAVGYGKFYYADVATGLVIIWNIKNPLLPERSYHFEEPVTAINFSKKNPNLLGVGFYSGSVQLLDISCRKPRVIGKSARDLLNSSPIWQIVFYKSSDYFRDKEQIITTSQDGRIIHLRQENSVNLLHNQIMRISLPEGKLKGLKTFRYCHKPGIQITQYLSALVIQQHPGDPNIYYIGTGQGTIHKCSRNYYYQHLDMFLAHEGPIYTIKFSPFCNKLFLTCGDDWCVRIWADGINEPLFELSKSMNSVQSADWSPTHSTIIASLSGTQICIWDLQRKTYLPQSVTSTPSKSKNTIVQFTNTGRCLIVGDVDGNVHIFALEDLPFPAFFQDDLLITAIMRGLITQPDLVKQLKKLGKLHFQKKRL